MLRSSATKLLWALLLALALVAGACGNDDDGGVAESPPTAAATMEATPAAPAPEPTPEATAEATPDPTPDPTPQPTEAPTAEAAPEPEPTEAPTAEAAPEPEPEDHPSGLDVQAINAAAADWMEKARIPGLVLAVALGDEDPWTFGWGVSDLATQD
ncbi:MAG: hypothetical protein OXN95_08510, partial [bacterium]|nr:hypothetical protein [bacterium]